MTSVLRFFRRFLWRAGRVLFTTVECSTLQRSLRCVPPPVRTCPCLVSSLTAAQTKIAYNCPTDDIRRKEQKKKKKKKKTSFTYPYIAMFLTKSHRNAHVTTSLPTCCRVISSSCPPKLRCSPPSSSRSHLHLPRWSHRRRAERVAHIISYLLLSVAPAVMTPWGTPTPSTAGRMMITSRYEFVCASRTLYLYLFLFLFHFLTFLCARPFSSSKICRLTFGI